MKAIAVVTIIAAQAAAFSMARPPAPVVIGFHPVSLLSYPNSSHHSSIGSNDQHQSTTSLNLSPASISGLLIRGGAAAVTDAPVRNFYGEALGYFGGIRIPATFLAGTSLAYIFSLKDAAKNLLDNNEADESSTLEKSVIKSYHFFSLIAFLLSLNTVVIATIAHTSILHGRFNEVAETAYMLMKREFEYEFVSVRWSFLTSIFMFLGMVTSRILIDFGLVKKGRIQCARKDMAMLTVCSMGALASHLLSYVNQSLWCWRSYPRMTVYLGQLIMQRAFAERKPLQILSVLLTAASTYYAIMLARPSEQEQ